MIRGTDSSANACTPAAGEALDAGGVGQRLQERDQHLSLAETSSLLGRGRRDLRDHLGRPRIADRRARFGVRLVGERRGLTGARLDDDVDAFTEASDRLGHERDAALTGRRFLGDAQTHRAKLSHRAGVAERKGIVVAPSTLARVTSLLLQYGLVLLFAMVAIESAGVPIPGETALITAAFFARPENHHWSLISVIVVAAAAAIIGDNIGYALGRFGGRALIDRWGLAKRYADKALPPSERFFQKHGAKTVFFGRFIAILRVTAAWLAGLSHMPWWRFFMWNAAGGIVWATGVSVLAYLAGKAVAETIQKYGLYGVLALLALGVVGFFALRHWRNRVVESA